MLLTSMAVFDTSSTLDAKSVGVHGRLGECTEAGKKPTHLFNPHKNKGWEGQAHLHWRQWPQLNLVTISCVLHFFWSEQIIHNKLTEIDQCYAEESFPVPLEVVEQH